MKFGDACCCFWQVLGLDAKRDGGWEVHTGLGTVTTNRCKVNFLLRVLRTVCLEQEPNISETVTQPLHYCQQFMIVPYFETSEDQLTGQGLKPRKFPFQKTVTKLNVRVINACGFRGREVGKLAGLDLPLVPVQHQVQHHHLALHNLCTVIFILPSVPCDEVSARGAGAEKRNTSSQAPRWIILPQVRTF